MSKKCAVCGERVGSDAIDCPKCGRGVFYSEKEHSDPMDSLKNASDTAHSQTAETRKGASFWKKLSSRKRPPNDRYKSQDSVNSLVLVCRKCGQTFRIGVDSSIMTFEGWAPQAEIDADPLGKILAARRYAQGAFDTVGRVRFYTLPEDNPSKKLNRREMERIQQSLARGEQRTWRCANCLVIQPYTD